MESIFENSTVFDLVEQSAKKHSNNIAYEFMGEKCSYEDFLSKVDNVAKSLISIGVKEDDIVSISLPNIPQALYFIYAINKIGAVVNLINCLSSEYELLERLNQTNSKVIIVIDQFYDCINNVKDKTSLEYIVTTSIIDEFPIYKKFVCKIFKNIGAYKSYTIDYKNNISGKEIAELKYNDFVKCGKTVITIPRISNRINKCAFILYSGGTTGKIKGVCLSNKNINVAINQLKPAIPKFLPKDKMLSVMPITHSNGLVSGIHLILSYGGTCVLMPRYSSKSYAHALIKYKCNFTSGVASIYDKVVTEKVLENKDLSFLKNVFCGADILPYDIEIKVNNFLQLHGSKAKIRQGYGLTESVLVSTINFDGREKIGSIGMPLDRVDIKIIDTENDKILNNNEIGEIIISSETNMIGYYNDELETKNSFIYLEDKKYIHTGDLGYIDSDGYVFFKSRIKNVIIKNGYNIFPLELENTILKCDIVESCCIIGVLDRKTIEEVVAYIKLKKGYEKDDASKQIITLHCKKHIAKYAIPKEIIFVDDFPKTKIGKIDLKILKEEYIKNHNIM